MGHFKSPEGKFGSVEPFDAPGAGTWPPAALVGAGRDSLQEI
jgi:hypothetical protein